MAEAATPASYDDRSNRLFQLLENASTSTAIRMSAAKQIAHHIEILYQMVGSNASIHVENIFTKLVKILLLSKSWEVRTASNYAIELSIAHILSYEEAQSYNKMDESDDYEGIKLLENFDFEGLLEKYDRLAASSGTEFTVDLSLFNSSERLKQQKGQLRQLLEVVEGVSGLSTDLIEDKDLEETETPPEPNLPETDASKLSARQKAMQRRKNKANGLPSSTQSIPNFELPSADKLTELAGKDLLLKTILLLRANLLNANWTVRHGSVLGLKTIVKNIWRWSNLLLAVLIRDILAVVTLDRFGDFVEDQAVAPVKETAAQTLTLLQTRSNKAFAEYLWDKSINLASYPYDWQVRQAGHVLIKYLCAAASDLSSRREELLSLCAKGCCDCDEDIRCLSAELLCRLVDPNAKKSILIECVFKILEEVTEDDNSFVSASSIVLALEIYQKAEINDSNVVKRLIPLLLSKMRHPSRQVRTKVLSTLQMIFSSNVKEIPSDLLMILRLVFQNIVLDDIDEIREASQMLALNIVSVVCHNKTTALLSLLVNFTSIVMTPMETPFDKRNFIFANLDSNFVIKISNEPPSHEIGFKQSDVMILKNVDVISSRRMAATIIQRIANEYDSEVKLKLASARIVRTDPLSCCAGIWAFGMGGILATKECSKGMSQVNDGDIWDLRLYCAKLLFDINSSIDEVLLAKYLGMEEIKPLQLDIAKIIGRTSNTKSLLSPVVEKSTRSNALFALCSAFKPDSPPPDFDHSELHLKLAYYLVSVKSLSNIQVEKNLGTYLLDPASGGDDLILEIYSACFLKCPLSVVSHIIHNLLPQLRDSIIGRDKLKILELLEHLFIRCSDDISRYASLFLVPVLKRIADSDSSIREVASRLFGLLVKLVPLRMELSSGLSADCSLQGPIKEAELFLSQFLGDSLEDLQRGGHERSSAIEHFKMPVSIKAELRPYQQAGVNWLSFLDKYGLNGALCDDMGLGKTLQTICMLASSHFMRQERNLPTLLSLIVCPSSLIGHWKHEIENYAPSLGATLIYSGSSFGRVKLVNTFDNYQVVITSYEIIRSDIQYFQHRQWNYIVLDEGHVIKNPKTKLSQAVKLLCGEHRLVLSGTPIQNNVVELWSLFDFLMPGILGSESEFMERYGRPIMSVQPLMTGNAKCSGSGGMKEFENAEVRLKALHKQVLPFVLRRMKEDVLGDLPPKIIQDYECEPSPIQKLLYEHYFNTSKQMDIVNTLSQDKPELHVFQALQYLRKICVHPSLVLTEDHPLIGTVETELGRTNLNALENSSKLQMLKELLEECCGTLCGEQNESARHRVLVFAQQKGTLDLIEQVVLREHLPSIRYLRLDGSVENKARFEISQRFNSDTSIDILLLTTQIGGLGLNLTGADTVIFVEHDWNPMKDLQAMDRAHRLGQKRVVTVYRLILKDTLEQQILGLQKWKTKVAATILKQQNLTSEGKDKPEPIGLLDQLTLLQSEPLESKSKKAKVEDQAMAKWIKKHIDLAVDASIDQMDDDNVNKEYRDAFNVDQFTKDMNRE